MAAAPASGERPRRAFRALRHGELCRQLERREGDDGRAAGDLAAAEHGPGRGDALHLRAAVRAGHQPRGLVRRHPGAAQGLRGAEGCRRRGELTRGEGEGPAAATRLLGIGRPSPAAGCCVRLRRSLTLVDRRSLQSPFCPCCARLNGLEIRYFANLGTPPPPRSHLKDALRI